MMSTAGSDPELGREIEDGELPASDGEDGTYIPLERPENFSAQLNPASIMNMQIQDDQTDESCRDSSSSGSESDELRKRNRPKKPKIKIKNVTRNRPDEARRSKYNIWCKTLQEDVLTEDMNSCEFLTKRHLGIESYDHTIKYRLGQPLNSLDGDHHTFDPLNDPLDRYPLKRKVEDRKNPKLRVGKRKGFGREEQKGASRQLGELIVNKDSPLEDVARDIADKLNEDKDGLVLRVVTIAGNEKAIEIYQETKRIEEDGGMMIMNGMRRRTPGGVYLFLVKRDDQLTKDDIKKIFHEDKQEINRIKKLTQAMNREKKVQLLKQSLTEGDLPALLARSEQPAVGIAESEHSERPVSNPPPSPATDGRDGSSDTDTQRSPRPSGERPPAAPRSPRAAPRSPRTLSALEADDDFLDLGCGDDMDLF